MDNLQEKIQVPVWWVPGNGMMYNRDCLSPDHPESTYNYIKNKLGLNPKDYGVLPPLKKMKCPRCGMEMMSEEEIEIDKERCGW